MDVNYPGGLVAPRADTVQNGRLGHPGGFEPDGGAVLTNWMRLGYCAMRYISGRTACVWESGNMCFQHNFGHFWDILMFLWDPTGIALTPIRLILRPPFGL